MAESRHAETIDWYAPERRGIFPLAAFHVPKRLVRTIKKHPFRITFNRDFRGVIRHCADSRAQTWINDEIIELYSELHDQGTAHSVEVWDDVGLLVGGVYGLSIGGAFFGESMFSRKTNASKIALVYLAARLWRQGYCLFDAQFFNPHLAQFGLVEISRLEYMQQLEKALAGLPIEAAD